MRLTRSSEEVERVPRPAQRFKKRKSSVLDEDIDMEDKADGMDVDENMKQSEMEEEEEEAEEEEVDPSLIDPEPAPARKKPRKKVEKKVVPLGKNGLKKKRVLKSRMKTNERGYMSKYPYFFDRMKMD